MFNILIQAKDCDIILNSDSDQYSDSDLINDTENTDCHIPKYEESSSVLF